MAPACGVGRRVGNTSAGLTVRSENPLGADGPGPGLRHSVPQQRPDLPLSSGTGELSTLRADPRDPQPPSPPALGSEYEAC